MSTRIAVLGYGAAGSAIVHELVWKKKYDVTVVSKSAEEGSTVTNQKWKHSGLLYPSRTLARRMWTAYQASDSVFETPFRMKPQARFLALRQETINEKASQWRQWGVRSWGAKWEPLAKHEYKFAGILGETKAVAGVTTPDCIMDFPELVLNLRRSAERRGATFIDGAMAQTMNINNGRVESVTLDNEQTIECDICIVAMGAWSKPFMEDHGVSLPVVLKKCIVLHYERELVPCLTVCLDIRTDPKQRDAALAPYKGLTIAAESAGEVVRAPDDLSIDSARVAHLIHEYQRCFPGLARHEPVAQLVCFKLEQESAGVNLDSQVFHRDALANVLFAIPGKASLMFTLAQNVAERVRQLTAPPPA